MDIPRPPLWLAVIILTLAAFALRLYRLNSSSLRGDEAFDALFARQPLPELLYQFRFVQPYPPLFHVGLHFWLPLAGHSEFAVRFWAAGCATLAVPAVYVLGTLLFNRRVGRLASLFAVVNPFVQWWGQDAHFYAYLLALATLLTVVALRLWRAGGLAAGRPHAPGITQPSSGYAPLTLLYILVALFSFLTHYFAYFVWGALTGVAAVQTLRRRWPSALTRRWWGAQALLILLYLPWLILTMPVVSSYVEPWIERTTPWDMLWRDLVAFSVGYSPPLTPLEVGGSPASALVNSALVGCLGLLFLGGVILGWRRSTFRPGVILTLALMAAPLAVMYVASFHRPIFDEKLTIFLLPLYLVVLALGILGLAGHRRWAGWLAGLMVMLVMSAASYQYLANENLAKSPAWRELLAYVHGKAQADDLLIYNFPEPSIIFYNADRLPLELIPDSAGLTPAEIGAQLEQAVASYRRVWLAPLVRPWWDARGDVIAWLDRHADRLDQRFFRGVHVSLYLAPSAWQAVMTPQPVTFADGIHLHGFRLAGGDADSGPVTLAPGNVLQLSLYWQADGPTRVPYTVFTHLIGPDGQLYGQWDNPPVRGTYPTTAWSAGEPVVDQYAIPIRPDAPPGEYHVLVGLYDPGTGARLPVLDADGQAVNDAVQLNQVVTLPTSHD